MMVNNFDIIGDEHMSIARSSLKTDRLNQNFILCPFCDEQQCMFDEIHRESFASSLALSRYLILTMITKISRVKFG